jgi:hypothetical protein
VRGAGLIRIAGSSPARRPAGIGLTQGERRMDRWTRGSRVAVTGSVNGGTKHAAQVICTLAEHHYFYGVAALVNSLVRAGFEGTVVVGFRGERPDWLGEFARDPALDSYAVTPSVQLRLVEVAGPWHLANCKPNFIKDLLFEKYAEADLVYYFDADIVIKHSWSSFAGWARSGVVLVLDPADSYMSPHHVYRRGWQDLASRQNRACREFTGYVNSGCVGICRAYADFASVWSGLMEELEREGADMRKQKNTKIKLEFSRMDQDILNATVMATDTPIALLGTEAMGMFPWVGEVMPHAMWGRKPWQRNYILDALRGFPPHRTHRAYWEFVDGPIRPFNEFALFRKHAQLAVGHLIGQLHSRSYRDS